MNLVKILSERTPLALVDGHKRQIGRGLLLLSAATPLLQALFPHVAILAEIPTYVTAIGGWFGLELGYQHAMQKEKK